MVSGAQQLDPVRLWRRVMVPARPTTFWRAYINKRLSPQLDFEAAATAPRVELHLGTYAQTWQQLNGPGRAARLIEDKTSPEVWLSVPSTEPADQKIIITNILGTTRLLHFLAMLKIKGFPMEKVAVLDFQNDYAAWLPEMWREVNDKIQTAVFTFNPVKLAEQLGRKLGLPASLQANEFGRFYALPAPSGILVFDLQYAYGTQITPFLLALLKSCRSLRQVLVIGAAGGLSQELKMNEAVCFKQLYDQRQRLVKGVTNGLPAESLPFPAHNVDVVAAQTMFGETGHRLAQWRAKGIGAVELELAQAARVLRGQPQIKFGAVLRISDFPGTDCALGGEVLEQKSDLAFENKINNFLAAYLVSGLQ